MANKNVVISEGKRPFWQLVIAALHYTAIFYFLFDFVSSIDFFSSTKKVIGSLSALKLAFCLVPSALAFSVVRNFHFNLEQRKYKIEYCVGPFSFGRWRLLPKIEYVSIFKQIL